MISFIRALAAGAAVEVLVRRPTGSLRHRLLRRADADFTDQNDPDALLVHEGTDLLMLDRQPLETTAVYFYRVYDLMSEGPDVWAPTSIVSCTPAITFVDLSPDPLLELRARLDIGLNGLLDRGVLTHPKGRLPVQLGPPALDTVTLPVVTLHLTGDASSVRAIGEEILPDSQPLDRSRWDEHEGWLARVQIAVVGWCTNYDQRHALHKAIRAVVVANLPVLDDLGFTLVDFSQQQVEDFTSFNAPMYQTIGSFSCLAPVIVNASTSVIHTIDSVLDQP